LCRIIYPAVKPLYQRKDRVVRSTLHMVRYQRCRFRVGLHVAGTAVAKEFRHVVRSIALRDAVGSQAVAEPAGEHRHPFEKGTLRGRVLDGQTRRPEIRGLEKLFQTSPNTLFVIHPDPPEEGGVELLLRRN
jgi:hypothetical protein